MWGRWSILAGRRRLGRSSAITGTNGIHELCGAIQGSSRTASLGFTSHARSELRQHEVFLIQAAKVPIIKPVYSRSYQSLQDQHIFDDGSPHCYRQVGIGWH